MFLYLQLQLPILAAVAALLLADGPWTWPPLQTETAQWLLTALLVLIATLVAVALDRPADPNHLYWDIMLIAFLPPTIIALGAVRVCAFILRRLQVAFFARAVVGGLAGTLAVAIAPTVALFAGCALRGACP